MGARLFLPACVMILGVLLRVSAQTSEAARARWRGLFFRNTTFSEAAVEQRARSVEFFWASKPPLLQIPADAFSTQWFTCIHLRESKDVHVSLASDEGSMLKVDGAARIGDLSNAQDRVWRSVVHLEAGRHSVEIDYVHHHVGNAHLRARITASDGTDLGDDSYVFPEGDVHNNRPCTHG